MRKQSKKKLERKLLASLSFNEKKLNEQDKVWLLSLTPNLRGCLLSKHFSASAKSFKPSAFWINQQVAKACKWIRRQTGISSKETKKKLAKMTFEDIMS